MSCEQSEIQKVEGRRGVVGARILRVIHKNPNENDNLSKFEVSMTTLQHYIIWKNQPIKTTDDLFSWSGGRGQWSGN